MHDLLVAVAYGLMLPAIAVLHPRHARVRESGAILATISGTAAVVVGLGGAMNVDLQPAALFILGIWWWTVGKMWAGTGALPRRLGIGTAALGALALVGALAVAGNVGMSILRPTFPDLAAWTRAEAVLGAWLLALAVGLWRAARDVPSR